MVKDEEDIVEDWVNYHGYLVGFNNIFVIDNFSTDNTFKILQRLAESKGINLFQLPNYLKKGIYMTRLFHTFCNDEWGIPIDIDEFIVLYNKDTYDIDCNTKHIHKYLNTLDNESICKMSYINTVIPINNAKYGYKHATFECKMGQYSDEGIMNKSFFHSSSFRDVIDHGNHYMYVNQYYLTELCLIHYHTRNMDQIIKKIDNNLSGLGYSNIDDLYAMQQLANIVGPGMGYHHIHDKIKILNGTYSLTNLKPSSNNLISLIPFINHLKNLKNKILVNNIKYI
tara:strand:+ start:285 stop:1133 length:849 start_codon:yes stop_codon:yes gene_type:complete